MYIYIYIYVDVWVVGCVWMNVCVKLCETMYLPHLLLSVAEECSLSPWAEIGQFQFQETSHLLQDQNYWNLPGTQSKQVSYWTHTK